MKYSESVVTKNGITIHQAEIHLFSEKVYDSKFSPDHAALQWSKELSVVSEKDYRNKIQEGNHCEILSGGIL